MKTTKGKRIEGKATIVELDSWMPSVGPQWERPLVDFVLDGTRYSWKANDEHATRHLSVGDTVMVSGFAKPNNSAYRMKITVVPIKVTTFHNF